MTDFSIHESTEYSINCGGCERTTGYFSSPEEASKVAKDLGFVAADTPEDGTLNFCKECKASLDDDDGVCPRCEYQEGRSEADKRYHEENCRAIERAQFHGMMVI